MNKITNCIEKYHLQLVSEIAANMEIIKSMGKYSDYYNKVLKNIPSKLANLLNLLVTVNNDEWDKNKWIDDSLVTDVGINNEKLSIRGIMVCNVRNTTQAWTNPFYFEIQLPCVNSSRLIFLFGDVDDPEITWEEYNKHRVHWKFEPTHWKYRVRLN